MPQPNDQTDAIAGQIAARIAERGDPNDPDEPRWEFVALEGNGIVQVRAEGLGGCCPASALPWLLGLESDLKRLFPLVRLVELVA